MRFPSDILKFAYKSSKEEKYAILREFSEAVICITRYICFLYGLVLFLLDV